MREFNLYEPKADDFTDEQLLVKIRETPNINSSLTSVLFLRYMNLIKIKANKVDKLSIKSTVDADDLVSEGFLGLLSAIRTFNEEKGSFASYANACINNKIKTAAFGSGYKNIHLDDDFDISQTPDKSLTDEIVIEKESESEIEGLLCEILSETELKVFSLYLNSYSYSKIASLLSISVKSVDNALSRARAKLRKVF